MEQFMKVSGMSGCKRLPPLLTGASEPAGLKWPSWVAGGRCLASALGGTLGHSWPGSEISLHTPLPQPRVFPATLSRSVWPLPPARGHALPARGPEAGDQPRLRGEEIYGAGPLQDGPEPLAVSKAGWPGPSGNPYPLQAP